MFANKIYRGRGTRSIFSRRIGSDSERTCNGKMSYWFWQEYMRGESKYEKKKIERSTPYFWSTNKNTFFYRKKWKDYWGNRIKPYENRNPLKFGKRVKEDKNTPTIIPF